MITLPVFIVQKNGDTDQYGTLEEAESSVEAVDVKNGEYDKVFDSVGKKLYFSIEKERRVYWLGLIKVDIELVKIIERV